MARSKSSNEWMQRHVNDEYVKRSQIDGYRSRATYKLLEIDEKDKLIKKGQTVVDLGAAPGGWSQVVVNKVGDQGRVVGIDLLEIDPMYGAEFMQGDFADNAVYEDLMKMIDGDEVDLVISDIAPNVTGMNSIDQPKSIYLVELALDFATQVLKENGAFVVKVFQGAGFDDVVSNARGSFKRVVLRKPKSSRPKSREVYIVATGFKG